MVTPFGSVTFTVQPLMAELPAVTVTVPWNPPCHVPTWLYVALHAPLAGAVVGGFVVGGFVVGGVVAGGVVVGGAVVGGVLPIFPTQWSFACTMLNCSEGQSNVLPDGGLDRLELLEFDAVHAPFCM